MKNIKKEILEKVEFLKKNYPNINKINPYTDLGALTDIKFFLHENHFYKGWVSSIPDSSILNLVLIAQGKRKCTNAVYSVKRLK